MKSERRHELSQNVLSAKITEAASFVRRHGTRLAWAVLVAVIIVLIIVVAVNKRRQKRENLWADYYRLLGQGDKLNEDWFREMQALADQDTIELLSTLALVKLGDGCATLPPEAPAPLSPGQSAAQAAGQYYRTAIDRFPEFPAEAGRARLGLARLALARGDIEAARAECDAIAASAELLGYPVVAQAVELRQRLDEIAAPVIMTAKKPTTRPAEGPESRPASRPATEPSTAPSTTRPAAEGGAEPPARP